MEEMKNRTIEKIESKKKYSNSVFLVAEVEKVEDSEFVNCSFRKKIQIDLAERCKFENSNFVNLVIKEKKETELEKCIFPQVEKIPLEVSLASWNSEYFDFSVKNWGNLEHGKQREYAQTYQRWYAKEKRLELTKRIYKNDVEFVFKLIPPGKYWMGSPESEKNGLDYEKQHCVLISNAFWIAETPLTQEQWKVVRKNSSKFKEAQNPVEMVSWHDCKKFCAKTDFIMPTEAQWEYACRAGTTAEFNLGNNINTNQVNYYGNHPHRDNGGIYREQTVLVKSLANENSWGCYDFHGNVWEWCADWFSKNYYMNGQTNPQGPNKGNIRVLRGGCWDSDIGSCRSSSRNGRNPWERYMNVGFRCALQ